MFKVYLKKPGPQPYYPSDCYTVYSIRTDNNENLCFLVYFKKHGWSWEFADNFIPIEGENDNGAR